MRAVWLVACLIPVACLLPGAAETSEITALPPTLEVRDSLKEAETHRIEYECGILSPQTWSQRLGLDFEQEQTNWQACAERGMGRPAGSGAEDGSRGGFTPGERA